MRASLASVLVVLLSGLIACTAQRVFTQPNSAMEPTIMQGEKFTVATGDLQPSRGDLIVFEHGGVLLVKRVIAVSGDTVEGRDLKIFVNGKILDEPHVQHTGPRPLGIKSLETFGPVEVPQGKLFVAGDNRDYSLDSRDPQFGLVSAAEIKGKPVEIVESPRPERAGRTLR